MTDKATSDLPFVEKYRPDSLDELIGHKLVKQEIEVFLMKKRPINLLIVGPPGTGKTSLARIIAERRLGDEFSNETYLEFNASDERGIDFVRDKIKNLISNEGKIVITLDEGEYLTKPTKDNDGGAQPALRRLAEEALENDKFLIITCNDTENIIQPIISRFKLIVLPRLSNDEIKDRLLHILDSEGVAYDTTKKKAFIGQIVIHADGDLRTAINNLDWHVIDGELVITEGMLLHRQAVERYYGILDKVVNNGDFLAIREDLIDLLYKSANGLLPSQAIQVTHDWIMERYSERNLIESKFLQYMIAMRECDKQLSKINTRKYIQLIGMLAEFRYITLR